MINAERAKEVCSIIITHGKEKASRLLGVSVASLSRYERVIKQITRDGEKKPVVIIIDIETLPNTVWTWGMWQQNVSDEQIVRSGCLLSFSIKYLFEPEIFSEILTPREAKTHDDKRLTKLAWEWLNGVDIVIAHNGRAFDTQYLNAQFIKHGLKPPSAYKIIDTLNIKKVTRFQKNSLKYLCKELGLREKLGNDGFALWARCENGEQDALDEMLRYNEGDVLALEDLYVRLRPWLPNHPNMSLFIDGTAARCGRCNSERTMEYVGDYATNVNLFKSYRCSDCGSIMRVRQSSTPRVNKPNLLINTSVQ
jgi:hypothetical protein